MFIVSIGARIRGDKLYIGWFQWTNIKDIVRIQRSTSYVHGDCTKILCKNRKPLRFNFSYMDGKTCRKLFRDLLDINRNIKFEFPLEKIASIKPRYPKKLSSEWLTYFEQNSDDIIKFEYPTFYAFTVFILIPIALLGPISVFYSIVHQPGGFIGVTFNIIGFIGSLMFGIGLLNLLAGLYGQYLGHLVSKITLGGGGAFMILSWYVMSLFK